MKKKMLLPASSSHHAGSLKKPISLALFIALTVSARAQTGNGAAGLQQANTMIGSYFDAGCTIMYSIGAIVGLVGAVKVYNAWSHGDQQTNKLAASWFGACIFLVVVAAVLKSFFGVS
jgi:hypothetical protein